MVELARPMIDERLEPIPLLVKDKITLRVSLGIEEREPGSDGVVRNADSPRLALDFKRQRSDNPNVGVCVRKFECLRVFVELRGPCAEH